MGNNIQGERLKASLSEKNIQQKTLAEMTNFSVQHISNIVRGKRNMSPEAAASFSEVLGVLPEYLLGRCDYKTNSERLEIRANKNEKKSAIIRDYLSMNGISLSKILAYSDTETFCLDPTALCLPNFRKKDCLGKQIINDKEVYINDIKLYAFLDYGKEIELDIEQFKLVIAEILDFSEFTCRKIKRNFYKRNKNI